MRKINLDYRSKSLQNNQFGVALQSESQLLLLPNSATIAISVPCVGEITENNQTEPKFHINS
jgi:hypothetical protein